MGEFLLLLNQHIKHKVLRPDVKAMSLSNKCYIEKFTIVIVAMKNTV